MADRPASQPPKLPETLLVWLAAIAGAVLLLTVATIPLAPRQQAIFAVGTLAVFLIANLFRGRAVSGFLAALSLTLSLRYLFWRITETMPSETTWGLVLGVGLVLAECYAVAVLALGYLQTLWPLQRKIMPLSGNPIDWPTVDVFIPTYNEPMSVVRATMLAAIGLDWPADKLRVWLLDDGQRDEFRRFAEQIGCGYIARTNNLHAKAGNLNHALARTHGAFVAVFDCDHIPTRSFLQLTLGWLVAEPNLAVVQTPHHFHTPDPFQRSLAAAAQMPPESLLFHGLVQDGNDTFNAACFAGSCAVLRRSALDEIGGIAVESVTEDAQTMLRLHRHGWDSAYLGMPMAAGLAPERLSRHLGQRMRWARGMLQILRLDNPMFGPGLSLGQRLCYLQATGHFLFAVPRLVFLTAPLAFLLLGQNVIAASPLAISAYALQHIIHAVATNSRLRGSWRHSFWSGIYETVLALFLVRVVVSTLLRPRRGTFGVTAKGGRMERGRFDLRAVAPNLLLALLLLAGLIRGIVGLAFSNDDPLVLQALLLNGIWAVVSLLTVLAALAVGREPRRAGAGAGIPWATPITVKLPGGGMLEGVGRALSRQGGALAVEAPGVARAGMDVEAVFALATGPVAVPAHVVRAESGMLQLRWEPRTLEQEALLIQAVFGRADAWSHWSDYARDRPLLSLWRVLASIGGLFRSSTAPAAVALLLLQPIATALAETRAVPAAHATTVRAAPQPLGPLPTVSVPPAAVSPAVAEAPPPAAAAPSARNTRQVVLSLHQLGAPGSLALRGTSPLLGLDFGIRADEVVTAAQLHLSGALSPALLPEFSNVTITLNEQYVGTIPASREHAAFSTDLPISPVFFQDTNQLRFAFAGRYTPDCNDPLSGLLWATIYDASTLSLTLERLPPERDLTRLPLPFFDPRERQRLVLPFILPAAPDNDALRAAAIASSWFGVQAGVRGAGFAVLDKPPSEGDAVLIAIGSGEPAPGLPPPNGPTVAVIANPNDPQSSLLVVAGRTGEEAVAAATALSLGSRALAGAVASVQAPALTPRTPYDAPAWIPTSRPVRLGELVESASLQSYGYTGLLHVPFRTAPDFATWRDAPFALDLRFRAPPGPVIDLAASRLDVGLNGIYLTSQSLAPDAGSGLLSRLFARASVEGQARIGLPAYDVYGANDLQLYFDARPLHRGDCAATPGDLRMAVDPDSTIDLSRGVRFAQLPNLAYFIGAGFPFTRMADLSETAIVVPDRPTPAEIGTFLDLMGQFGGQTGFPVTRVAVTRPEGVRGLAQRDFLVVGTLPRLGGIDSLLTGAPIQFDGTRVALALPSALDSVRRVFGDRTDADRQRVAAVLSAGLGDGTALLVGGASPLASGRSVVALLAPQPEGLAAGMETLRVPEQAAFVAGDLALLSGGRVTSYRVGATYSVGTLPFWMWPAWMLHDQPFGLLAVTLVAACLLGLPLVWLLRRQAQARQLTGQITGREHRHEIR